MEGGIKELIDGGKTDGLREALVHAPELASEYISWGGQPCKTEPLHYLSDGFLNGLWQHENEGELAEILIQAGAAVDGLPDAGETPLHGAASLGCRAVAETLVRDGANLEPTVSYPGVPDGTPLDFAVHFGMVDVVDLLVESGAEVLSARIAAGAGLLDELRTRTNHLKEVAFQEATDIYRCAAVCNRIEVVNFLFENGVDVNTDIKSATALHWAAWEAKPQMVAHLIANGADPNREDSNYNMTPIDWARHRKRELGRDWGHAGVIDILESGLVR